MSLHSFPLILHYYYFSVILMSFHTFLLFFTFTVLSKNYALYSRCVLNSCAFLSKESLFGTCLIRCFPCVIPDSSLPARPTRSKKLFSQCIHNLFYFEENGTGTAAVLRALKITVILSTELGSSASRSPPPLSPSQNRKEISTDMEEVLEHSQYFSPSSWYRLDT